MLKPEAICIRVHGDGAKELVGDWPKSIALLHSFLANDAGIFSFDGQGRLDVVVNDQQHQAYRLVFWYWAEDAALFLREDLVADD